MYTAVFEDMDIPKVVQECASGIIPPPGQLVAPFSWYTFPPALVPIWSNGDGYLGIWNHSFVSRAPTYVKFLGNGGRYAIEIARTPEQLWCYLALNSICTYDGITPDLVAFSQRVGFADLNEIDQLSQSKGQDASGLFEVACFQSQTPLRSIHDLRLYDGDFPVNDLALNTRWLWRSCSFDLEGRVAIAIAEGEVANCPEWLTIDHGQESLFEQLICEGNLEEAWLCLNSTGWSIPDAIRACGDLSLAAKSRQLDNLLQAWMNIADPTLGGY